MAWVLYKHVALFRTPPPRLHVLTAGQALRGGGCGHLELSGGGGSHGWNYLIRTGIQPRTKATSCFGYYPLVPLPTPVNENERCQMGFPPGKMPVSPDRRLLVFLAG